MLAFWRALPFVAGLSIMPGLAAAQDDGVAFSVNVTLSPKAVAKLAAKHQGAIVWAFWFGDPAKAQDPLIDEEGHIDLGTQKMHIPGEGGVAQMTGRRVKLALRKRLKDATVTVLVNVYSARRTPSEDNYLDCGIFQDNVTLAQEKPVEIACKLIEEE